MTTASSMVREAVTFLVALKNAIQDPTRILIDL